MKNVHKACRTATAAVKGGAGNNNVKLDTALTCMPLICGAIVCHHHFLILCPQHSQFSVALLALHVLSLSQPLA